MGVIRVPLFETTRCDSSISDSPDQLFTIDSRVSRDNNMHEAEILSHLPTVLLGQSTPLFAVSPNSVSLPPIPRSYTGLLRRILEAAILYQDLEAFVAEKHTWLLSPIKSVYVGHLHTYLAEYADSVKLMVAANATLLGLLRALEPIIQNFRTLCEVSPLLHRPELELLHFSHSLCNYNNEARLIGETLRTLLWRPYYAYIEDWVVSGNLTDLVFFVELDPAALHFCDIIKSDPARYPTFLGLDDGLYEYIYQTGRLSIFLEKYCEEEQWVQGFLGRYRLLIGSGLADMTPKAVLALVRAQHAEALAHFTVVMHSKFLLLLQVRALHEFMLMASGDFILSLHATELEQPALQLTSAKIHDILAALLQNSRIGAAREHLNARAYVLDGDKLGWEVFSIEYRLLHPALETVLNKTVELKDYQRVFSFLWTLKLVEHLLCRKFVERVDFMVYAARQRMLNFVFKLSEYLFVEIHERYTAYVALYYPKRGGSAKAHGLKEMYWEEIIEGHSAFVLLLAGMKLLDEGAIGLSGALYVVQTNEVVEIIVSFCKALAEYQNMVGERWGRGREAGREVGREAGQEVGQEVLHLDKSDMSAPRAPHPYADDLADAWEAAGVAKHFPAFNRALARLKKDLAQNHLLHELSRLL